MITNVEYYKKFEKNLKNLRTNDNYCIQVKSIRVSSCIALIVLYDRVVS